MHLCKKFSKIQLPLITALVIVVAISLFCYTYFVVHDMMEQACYERLSDTASAIADNIGTLFHNNEVALDIAAENLAGLDDLDSAKAMQIIRKYSTEITASRVSILTPDNTVVTTSGIFDSGGLDFEEIAPLGKHFSVRDESRIYSGQTIFRQFVPIRRDHKTVGMIYAVYICSEFEKKFPVNFYDGDVYLYLVDRRDGNIVADTYSQTFDNLYDRAPLRLKGGGELSYDDIINGGSGIVNVKGNSSGRSIFMAYSPTSLKEYSVTVSIFSDIAMGSVTDYRNFVFVIGLIEILIFIGYDTWIIRKNRRNMEKISELANTDALTGAGSLVLFGQDSASLDSQISNGVVPEFAVVECDLNNLKKVNDSNGHEAGNEYIRRCCKVMCDAFPNSQVYRIGGDEFAIILLGEDFVNRAKIVKKLQSGPIKKGYMELSFATGIADYIPGTDNSTSEVLKRADAAMYEHKQKMKAKMKDKNNESRS